MKEFEYDVNNINGGEVKTPFLFKGNFSAEDVSQHFLMTQNLKDFIENPEESEELSMRSMTLAATLAMSKGKNKRRGVKLDADGFKEFSELIGDYYDFFNEKEKFVSGPVNSYRKRLFNTFKNYNKMLINGDVEIIQNAGLYSPLASIAQEFGVDFPSPIFSVKDENGNIKEETKIDYAEYEKRMKKFGFADILMEEVEYDASVLVPFLEAKKRKDDFGAMHRKCKKKTYDHLLRQKKNIEKMLAVTVEDVIDMYPFSKTPTLLKNNWQGDRYGQVTKNIIDNKISALEHGLSVEDLAVVGDLYFIRKSILQNQEISQRDKTKYAKICEDFSKTNISTPEERQKLYDTLVPVYKVYRKYSNNRTSEEMYNRFDKVKKEVVDLSSVSPDERDRRDMIKKLEEYIKGLSVKHRGTLHSGDSTEMGLLKDAAKKTLRDLKAHTDSSIYDDDLIRDDFDTLTKLAHDYAKKKKDDAVESIKAKGYDEEKERQLIRDWKPSSRMGRIRLKTAKEMDDVCGTFLRKLRIERKTRTAENYTLQDIKDADFNIMRASDFKNTESMPYKAGIAQIINNYSMKPSFVPEFCGDADKLYSKDFFLKNVKQLYVPNITNETFGVVAYAAVFDSKNVDLSIFGDKDTVIQTTNEDTYRQSRTMFTMDMALDKPRASMYEHFYKGTIGPARDKAQEALIAYRNGDNSLLADIMAQGMKELQHDCVLTSELSTTGNFAFNAGMLAKMGEFINKDKALHDAVVEKFGPEVRAAINDTLRIKTYMDESIQGEQELQRAKDNKKELSVAEKRQHIHNIIRFNFMSAYHKDAFFRMQEDDPASLQYRESEEFMKSGFGMKGVTNQDVINKDFKNLEAAIKPIYEINGRLRTKEGKDKLNADVDKIASSIDPNASVDVIIKQIGAFKETINNMKMSELKAMGANKVAANQVGKEKMIKPAKPMAPGK
ncbi:MAG: hypothetical protein K6F77_03830 [Lachnospiraceae bacterium]|nr:hypothetical protein [Lachnospiraceae bacterium]